MAVTLQTLSDEIENISDELGDINRILELNTERLTAIERDLRALSDQLKKGNTTLERIEKHIKQLGEIL
jgi:chromosome segregation ATPase